MDCQFRTGSRCISIVEVGEILVANYAAVMMGKDSYGLKSHEAVVIDLDEP